MQTSLACCAFLLATPLKAQEDAFPLSEPGLVKRVFVKATGACPSALEVNRELMPLLSSWSVAETEGEASTQTLLEDLGDSFRISVQGEVRDVANTPPDCDERARIAAVIIAMQLETPGPAEPPQEKKEQKRALETDRERPVSPANGSTLPKWEAQAGLLVAGGFDGFSAAGLGPRLAAQLTLQRWMLRLSAGAMFFSRIEVDQLSLSYSRFPTDLAVGPLFDVGALRVSPSLALAMDKFLVEAPELAAADREVRLDVGARLSLQLCQTSWPLRPFLDLQGSWFPRDFELYVSPQGEIARTPNFWWGVSLGGSFTLNSARETSKNP